MPGTLVAPEGGAGGQRGRGEEEEEEEERVSSSSNSLAAAAGGRDRSFSWSAAGIPSCEDGERKPGIEKGGEKRREREKVEVEVQEKAKKKNSVFPPLTVDLARRLRQLPFVELGCAQGGPELGRYGALSWREMKEYRERKEKVSETKTNG